MSETTRAVLVGCGAMAATWLKAAKETGNTIIPTKLFINEKGLAKIEIGLAKGKKNYDKRQSLKEKEDKRSIDRAMKD